VIEFRDVTKGFYLRDEYFPVLRGVSLKVPTGRSVALLGRNGAGKTTLLKLVSGMLRPDSGQVLRYGSVSWPIGGGSSVHRELTGEQNTRFLARVYGIDSDELVDFVEDFSELGKHFYMPIRTYSSGMKSRLTFGIAMGMHFDTYLVDEVTAVGDARFKMKSRAVFRKRLKNASALMVSHSLSELGEYCDSALLLHDGKLRFFDDLNEAIDMHTGLMV